MFEKNLNLRWCNSSVILAGDQKPEVGFAESIGFDTVSGVDSITTEEILEEEKALPEVRTPPVRDFAVLKLS